MSASAAERRVLDEAGGAGPMTAVMGVMVFLTVLVAALGLATLAARNGLDRQIAGRLTVQVIDGDPSRRDAGAGRVLALLRARPDVERAEPVDAAAMAELLRPWLGSDAEAAGLPIPAMIDVDLRDPAASDRVAAAVARVQPGARVEAQGVSLSPVSGFMASLTWLAGLLVALMAGATAAVVVLAARAGLEAHRETIGVMHMLGSTDVQVARLFQRRLAIDAALGGGIGAGVAALVVVAVGWQVRGLGSELIGAATLTPRDWVILALLPVAFVALATLAARIAVVAALMRTL
jgi:cell division transport system permease protein